MKKTLLTTFIKKNYDMKSRKNALKPTQQRKYLKTIKHSFKGNKSYHVVISSKTIPTHYNNKAKLCL